MFNYIDSICLTIFQLLYKFIHTHLTSYILIVILCGLIIKLIWKQIQNHQKLNNIILKFTMILTLMASGIFSIWFICFHFHTFRIIQ